MDAHVFRRCCDSLVPLLLGARLEKIQSPAPDVHIFTFFLQGGRKQYLILRAGRQHPWLFLSSEKVSAGVAPSAAVMRLRKFVGGRRVATCIADWVGRRLNMLFGQVDTGAHKGEECWLVLDLREGPSLWMGQAYGAPGDCLHQSREIEANERAEMRENAAGSTPIDLPAPVLPLTARWPAYAELDMACADWRQWPVLTPALRRTLPHMEELDRLALLSDLECGGGDIFCYLPLTGDTGGIELSAWPLPEVLRRGREEVAREDVLDAVSQAAAPQVLGRLTQAARAAAVIPLEREVARLERLLLKQEAEEKRLRAMCSSLDDALVLQAVLWRCQADAKMAALDVPPVYDGESVPHVPVVDKEGRLPPLLEGWRRLTLNPRLSLRENMDALFHRAKRGKRGLSFVAERRAHVLLERDAMQEAATRARMGLTPIVPSGTTSVSSSGSAPIRFLFKGVQGFVSSDGFAILRGQNVKGNLTVLRQASPHDIWLHVEGGPGSHAVIRRDFAGQEIPERTLLEAGALVACKSWQKDNDRATVLYAEARHIKPMRNAAPGMVRIDKVLTTRVVPADADVETRLALPERPGT